LTFASSPPRETYFSENSPVLSRLCKFKEYSAHLRVRLLPERHDLRSPGEDLERCFFLLLFDVEDSQRKIGIIGDRLDPDLDRDPEIIRPGRFCGGVPPG
jgi:hypothetical protein